MSFKQTVNDFRRRFVGSPNPKDDLNHVPDDKTADIESEHVEPVDAVDLEDRLLRYNNPYDDEDQRVGEVGECLPEPEIIQI